MTIYLNKRQYLIYGVTAILIVGVYSLIFNLLYIRMGRGAIHIIPLVVAPLAWLGGRRAGLIVGILIVPYSTLLITLIDKIPWDVIGRDGGIGMIAMIFIGVTVGWLRDLSCQLKQELYHREQSERALRISEARFAGILDIAHEAIISIDQSRKIILFNKGAEQIFGYTACEVLGETLDLLIPERFHTSHWRMIAEFSAAPESIRHLFECQEIYGRRKNDEEFPAEASISELKLGEQTLYTAVLRDITKRRRTEQALRESEARYRAIVQDQTELIYRYALDGKRTFVNDAYRRYLGTPPETATLDPFGERIPSRDYQRVKAHLEALNQKQPVSTIEHRIIFPDTSETRWIHRTDRAIFDEQGQFVEYQFIGHDITELKRAEQRLQEMSAQLSEANGQLIYLLKRFVPERVAQRLIRDRNLPDPGGEQQRETTILFADMRNFTAAAEQAGPAHVLDMLNAYLAVIGEIVRKYQGSVIQYVGDLVMVTFNVPDDQPDHPLRAARAALAMRDSLEHFITEQQSGGWPILRFGFGLHTGTVITGYLGARDRYVYAAVGDATNVAYHICSQAQGGQIIISQTTLDLLGERANIKPLGTFPLKRRRDTYPMYQLESLVE